MPERTAAKKKRPVVIEEDEAADRQQIAVRFPSAVIDRADALTEKMGQPGINVSRSGVLRVALMRGLDVLERAVEGQGRRHRHEDPEVTAPPIQTAVRLSPAIVERVDAFALKISQPGITVSRSETMRLAILRGLDSLERKYRNK